MDSSRRGFLGILGAAGIAARSAAAPALVEVKSPVPVPVPAFGGPFWPGKVFAVEDPARPFDGDE